MADMTGRTALVTGASSGFGLAIAEAFAAAGADVILLARDVDRLAVATKAVAEHGGAPRSIVGDLSDLASLETAVRDVAGDVDVLVNNVGLARFGSLADTTVDDLQALMAINLIAPFRLTQLLLPGLTTHRGVVINMSSYWADKMVAGRFSAAYSASRGAIESFTRALANELGPCGVRVNALAPGSVRTPTFESTFLDLMTAEQRTEYDVYVARSYPLGRIGRPDDVAAAATYLASYEASWITGVVLPVDGGFTVR